MFIPDSRVHTTLMSLLRISIFCRIGSTQLILPIRPKNSILNRVKRVVCMCLLLMWRILSRTSTDQSGKNEKKKFYLLGFKYTLRTCFESKNFLPKSCPELSNQVLSFSEGQIYQQFRVRVRQSVFNFLTSDGQVWIKLMILRPFPEQYFSVLVK